MSAIFRVLVTVSGLLVLATAVFHYTGYESVISALAEAELPGFFAAGLPMLWLYFSWHLIVISGVLFSVALLRPGWSFPAMVFCAFVLIGDFGWVFSVAGVFPGTIMLFSAAVLLLIVVVRVSSKHEQGT